MQYRKMGRWGVKLSVIGLGSYLTMGFKTDDDTAKKTIQVAYDGGVNFFDTADAYNKGAAETFLGSVLADYPRESYFLLTKCWLNITGHVNGGGLSAKHIVEACNASLRRLNMDYVDLFMCHRPDWDTPLDETVRAMEDLARQGKIIYWGVSEWPAHMIARANKVAGDIGARCIGVSEPRYNLLYRYPERNLFPATTEEGVGNVIFSPLAHGMLTGKYKPGEEAPAGTRAADDDTNAIIKRLYWSDEQKRTAQEFVTIARDIGATPAQLAIAWCLKNPAVTSVIIGATKVSQVEDNLGAAELDIPDDVMAKLDELYPPTEAVECEK